MNISVNSLLKNISPKNRVLLLVIGMTTLLSAIVIMAAPRPDKKPAEETAWPVSVLEAEKETLSPEIALFGRVETPRTSLLTSTVSTYVKSVKVKEGDRVEEGDVLIQLDQVDSALLIQRREADLAEAEATMHSLRLQGQHDTQILEEEIQLFTLLEKKAARFQKLRADNSISEETLNSVLMEVHQRSIYLQQKKNRVANIVYDEARSAALVKRAKTLLDEARVQLYRTRITAPFSGRVTRVAVSPGELVSPGVAVAEMYDESAMEIRVQIPNQHLASIRQTLEAHQSVEAEIRLREGSVVAYLDRLASKVHTGLSGIDGLFRLKDANTRVELGRSVSMNLKLPAVKDTIRIPAQSIYGDNRVFVVVNERLKGVSVNRLGDLMDESGKHHVLVHSDNLSDGSKVLTSQLSNAVTGLRVSIRGTAKGEKIVPQTVGFETNTPG